MVWVCVVGCRRGGVAELVMANGGGRWWVVVHCEGDSRGRGSAGGEQCAGREKGKGAEGRRCRGQERCRGLRVFFKKLCFGGENHCTSHEHVNNKQIAQMEVIELLLKGHNGESILYMFYIFFLSTARCLDRRGCI